LWFGCQAQRTCRSISPCPRRTISCGSIPSRTAACGSSSEPFHPRQVYEKRTGAQLNMVSQSWDGKRLYFTSSLLANWDKKGKDNEQFLKVLYLGRQGPHGALCHRLHQGGFWIRCSSGTTSLPWCWIAIRTPRVRVVAAGEQVSVTRTPDNFSHGVLFGRSPVRSSWSAPDVSCLISFLRRRPNSGTRDSAFWIKAGP